MLRLFTFILMLLAVIVLVPAASAADPFGTAEGTFNGVAAYSNGSNGYYSNKLNYVGKYCTGCEWQCVEYAARYYKQIYNLEIAGGNANTWYNNAAAKGLHQFPNNGPTKPAVGDVLCSAYSLGHVCIIREVGSNYVKVIQQNWDNSKADESKQLVMTVSNGHYTINAAGSYTWQGWLRK